MKRYIGTSNGVDNYSVSSSGTFTLSAATKDTIQPLAGFDAHTAAIGSQRIHAYLLRPDNPQVQLSYVSLAAFAVENSYTATTVAPYPTQWFRSFAYFGNRTIAMPTSGTASYTGTVLGYGVVTKRADSVTIYADAYDVTGRAALTVDFGKQTFSATLDDLVGSRQFLLPNADPSGGTYLFSPIAESGILISGANMHANMTGHDRFYGSFFGPKAAEFALFFEKRFGNPGVDPLAWHLVGVAAGKKN